MKTLLIILAIISIASCSVSKVNSDPYTYVVKWVNEDIIVVENEYETKKIKNNSKDYIFVGDTLQVIDFFR